jgi:hypothetical protein
MPPVLDIDTVVTVRSSVLPLYLVIENGTAVAKDEVAERDFLTTIVEGNTVALRSYTGDFLSVRNGEVCTSRFLGPTEKFTIEQTQYQYSLQIADGRYLCFNEKDNTIAFSATLEDTGMFQLFSLMVNGMNVGKQLRSLGRAGSVIIPNLLDPATVGSLRTSVVEAEKRAMDVQRTVERTHDRTTPSILSFAPELIRVAAHPIVLQLLRRYMSPKLVCSAMRSVATDARAVRMDLENPTWSVPHPFPTTEWPPSTERLCARVVFILDDLDAQSSTWAYLPIQEDLPQNTVDMPSAGVTLEAPAGSCWIFHGPYWTTNSAGAGAFWKQEDAMARYKYIAGEKQEMTSRQEFVRVIELDFVREYVATEEQVNKESVLSAVAEDDPCMLDLTGPYSII